MAGADPLGDALRTLDSTDTEIKSVIQMLADELRLGHQEFRDYMTQNEKEKLHANGLFNDLAKASRDSHSAVDSQFKEMAKQIAKTSAEAKAATDAQFGQLANAVMAMQKSLETVTAAVTSPGAGRPSATAGTAPTPTAPRTGYQPEFMAAFLTPPQPGSTLAMAIDSLQVAYKRPDEEQQALRQLAKGLKAPSEFSDSLAS